MLQGKGVSITQGAGWLHTEGMVPLGATPIRAAPAWSEGARGRDGSSEKVLIVWRWGESSRAHLCQLSEVSAGFLLAVRLRAALPGF